MEKIKAGPHPKCWVDCPFFDQSEFACGGECQREDDKDSNILYEPPSPFEPNGDIEKSEGPTEVNKMIDHLRYIADELWNGRYTAESDILSDAADMLENLANRVPQWISVKEKLPERPHQGYARKRSDIVNAYTVKKEVVPARLYEDSKTMYWRTTEDSQIEVTHWMPLSKDPPEGEGR